MESMVAGFPLSLVHFTLIHQLVELSTSGGKSISAVASRMTVGAERFSPLTCILSLIMGEKLMNGEYGDWIPECPSLP